MNRQFRIGEAVAEMRRGNRVVREGWNGKVMHLRLVPGGLALIEGGKEPVAMLPYVMMKTVSGHHVPWLCSQTDLLAEDWEVVE